MTLYPVFTNNNIRVPRFAYYVCTSSSLSFSKNSFLTSPKEIATRSVASLRSCQPRAAHITCNVWDVETNIQINKTVHLLAQLVGLLYRNSQKLHIHLQIRVDFSVGITIEVPLLAMSISRINLTKSNTPQEAATATPYPEHTNVKYFFSLQSDYIYRHPVEHTSDCHFWPVLNDT